MAGTSGTRYTDEEVEAQEEAIAATLLAGGTWEDAAEAAGVSRRTVSRRLDDPSLRRRIDHERASVLYRIGDELASLSGLALGVYREILTDPTASSSQRLRAADGVLSTLRTYHVETALSDRFTQLEERLTDAEAFAHGDVIETTAKEIQE